MPIEWQFKTSRLGNKSHAVSFGAAAVYGLEIEAPRRDHYRNPTSQKSKPDEKAAGPSPRRAEATRAASGFSQFAGPGGCGCRNLFNNELADLAVRWK